MAKNDRLLFYVKKGEQMLHPTQHLFAAQLARECYDEDGGLEYSPIKGFYRS